MNTRGNSTHTAALIVVAVLAFIAVHGGGAWLVVRTFFGPVALPEPPKELPSPWPEPGAEPVREVPMPTGEMAAALPDYTAGHVLCSALPEQAWARQLGDSVLREVWLGSGCTVVTKTLRVKAELSDGALVRPLGNPRRTAIGGREATVYSDTRQATAVIVLVGASPPSWAKPVLEVSLEQHVWDQLPRDLPNLVRGIGEGLVAAITKPGPALPRGLGDEIPVHAADVPPGSGIVDAPTPSIAWQLCSALAQSTGRPLDEFVPKHDGRCAYRADEQLIVQASSRERLEQSLPDTIGGRPASVDNPSVTIQLTDDSPQQVQLAWPSPRKSDEELRAWAESLLPQLLGR
ncbi:hypothetical protein [Amycolatopsis sp. SID8362]|uniref:hypothetical protein n=1 Tax=Amycolatopsis sp. SID8362 TaxID=2690346 RepID=UPI00136A1335|nr:hypothetical protein [Amycolatopsis sp. SID8362]NBH10051.1 hypothetical protein [Amycolatopsis sp. SID8362]NED46745.1 hypothetical protein [Amycolatopsis sp. SID8362]